MSGFALALTFPRTDWNAVAWLALVPLLVTALSRSPGAALGWGWLFGGVAFLVLLRWLDFTFRVYSAIPWPLTWGPIALLAAYCGLYAGLVAWTLALVARRRSPGVALLASPFVWVAGEWIRGHLMGGFPWGTLGYSQYLRLSVIQIAELGGVHAVSFVVVAVNAAIAGCLVLSWRRALAGALAGAALLGATLGFGASRLAAPPRPGALRVGVVQPSIAQPLKEDPDYAATTLEILTSLTRRVARERLALIIWPETSVPAVLRQEPKLVTELAEVSREARAPLLVGAIDLDGRAPRKIYNTAFLVTENGIEGRYDKIHLVPFGEFVPLSRVIGFVRRWAQFIAELEPGTRAVVFPGPPAPFGVVICYEGIFPGLVRDFVRDGARLMVNMTNDAWFGRTDGPWQHLAMYPFRAVEHRIAVVRVANTGVSAVIAPSGQIVRRLGLFRRETMTEPVPLRAGRTLYTRFGEWLAYLSLVVTAIALSGARRRRDA